MKKGHYLPWLLVSLALVAIMPSSDSLWVDEAQTWSHVTAPHVASWFRNLTANGYSEALMPLGMFVAWICGKILGTTEWALRAPNLLWTALAAIAFWRIGALWRTPWAPLVFAVQPFVWFYTDEARPYALQIACGAWLALSLIEALHCRQVRLSSLLVLLGTSLVLVATTMFGIVTVSAVALVYMWLAWRGKWQLPARWHFWVGGAVIFTLACGIYYYLGLKRGATGAKLWNPGFSNVAFAIYEFGGFAGLGPGREQLRDVVRSEGIVGVLHALRSSAIPMALLALFYFVAMGRLIIYWRRHQHRDMILVLGGVFLAVVFTTATLAFIAKFPFWGRHLAPVFPFFAALVVLVLRQDLASVRTLAGWTPRAGILGVFLFSSLQLRFADRHRKDDYRNAAALARHASSQGETVWWIADPQGGRYYDLDLAPVAEQESSKPVVLITHENVSTLSERPVPELIVLSKPDIYDDSGAVRRFLATNSFQRIQQLKAFTIWRKPQSEGASRAAYSAADLK